MPSPYDANIFNKNPYFDDYDENKKYLRTLFKPGYAVQARELTQLQTVLQDQIQRVGTHIFENGAVILGGGIAESNLSYARIKSDDQISQTNFDALRDKSIANDAGVSARVLYTLAGSTLGEDPNQIVFFQYTSNGNFAEGSTLGTTGPDSLGITFAIEEAGLTAPAIANTAVLFSVEEGIFYVDGYFVKSDKSQIVPYFESGSCGDAYDGRFREFSSPTASIGWKVDRNIVTQNEDSTLRDPAAGFYNQNAPGADRFKIDLNLSFRGFTSAIGSASGLTFDTLDFLELVRMVGGSSTKTVKYTEYSQIEETLARRTYDESGNYTVISPQLQILNHGEVFSPTNDEKFAIGIEPNKSYVGGFEVDTQSTSFLEVDKARDTGEVESYQDSLNTPIGNYIFVDENTDVGEFGGGFGNGISADNNYSANSILNQSSYSLYSDDVFTEANGIGPTLGTCNIRAINREGNDLKVYLFNIKMGQSGGVDNRFIDTKYLLADDAVQGNTSDGSWYKVKADSTGWTGPHDASTKSLLYPVTNDRMIKDGPGSDPKYQSRFVTYETNYLHFTNGATGATIFLSDNKKFLNSDDEDALIWYGMTAGATMDLLSTSDYNFTDFGNKAIVELIGLTGPASDGATATVVTPVVMDSSQVAGNVFRTLTLGNNSEVGLLSTGVEFYQGATSAVFTLAKSHVTEITSFTTPGIATSLTDVSLDDGQRQSGYYLSKVYVPVTQVNSVGNDTYQADFAYNHYIHSGKGPVTLDSYPVTYENIPSFTDQESGKRFNLRKFIDFRPVQQSDKSFDSFGIPFYKYNRSRNSIGYSYYLPRIDKVCLCSDRTYRVIKGVSANEPQAPQTTVEDMDLYLIVINPYVFDVDTDVRAKYIDNKRFTMKQISELENQVENQDRDRYLANLVSDAIARGSQADATAIEESVLVDDFSTHAFADVSNRDHNCSINRAFRGLRPATVTNGFNCVVNTLPSGLTLTNSRHILYDFTEATIFTGNTGTAKTQINPFGTTDFLGSVEIEPTSDIYYDTSKNPKVIVNTFGENNNYLITGSAYQDGISSGWGGYQQEHIIHWLGSEDLSETVEDVDPASREYKIPNSLSRNKLPDRVLRTSGDRTVDESIRPFMRSVGITFTASGLLPGSTVYTIFDDRLVGNTTDGYSVSNRGTAEGHLTVTNSYLTGEKTFRLSDSSTNTLSTTTTAADAKFTAQGLLNSKSNKVVSTRAPKTRRRSVTSENVNQSMFLNTQSGSFEAIQNGLDPLAQMIHIDPGAFPQGLFLSSIDLFFSKADNFLPVNVYIKPVLNGAPHEFLVVPNSETSNFGTVVSDGPLFGSNINFKFDGPVYLQPGDYAICISTNSQDNEVYTSAAGDVWLNAIGGQNASGFQIEKSHSSGNGVQLRGILKPLNNGARVLEPQENLMMRLNRCQFSGGAGAESERTVIFKPTVPAGVTTDASIINVTSNEQLFTDNDINAVYNLDTGDQIYNGIVPNKDIRLDARRLFTSTTTPDLNVIFGSTSTNTVSPIIDLDRVGMLAVESKITDAISPSDTGFIIGETQRDSSASRNQCRYVSKKVSFGNVTANDIRVYLDVAPNQGSVKVFAKVNATGEEFDSIRYVQLYKDGNSSAESEWFNAGSGVSSTIEFKPQNGVPIGEYSAYAIKVVVNGDPDASTENALPVVKNLRSIALFT